MKLLTKYYDTFAGRVLPWDSVRLFADIPAAFTPVEGFNADAVCAEHREAIIRQAEEMLDTPYPVTLASDFIRFYRAGNREIFEAQYFTRRDMAVRFALAEALEGKGRFTDRIMDGVWLICDEADWVIPAHIPHEYALQPWYKEEHPYIDLFAAETGSTLAWIYALVRDALNAVTPQICDRLLYCLRERIIKPFLAHDMYWMGLDGRRVNNWNPWILSNVLSVCALTETDTAVREQVVNRVCRSLDSFIDGYYTDGGCDEGPSYWTAAGASMFDCLELLWDMTGGYVDVFGEELVRRMGEYEVDFHIDGDYFINFADCPAHMMPSARLIGRYGRRTGSRRMIDFGAYFTAAMKQSDCALHWKLYRSIKSICEIQPDCKNYQPAAQSWYNGIQVMSERADGLFLACKGGHNAESHNHNDVGSFIIYADGEPLILDAGVGQYTKKTFSSERYTIWSMCSDYHNLPTVNGCTQQPGGNYRAKDVVYDQDGHSLTLDIAPAHPAEAGLVSLKRTAKMADGVISVSDDVKLSAPGSVVFTLMCGRKPIIGDGVITFDGGFTLRYPSALTAVLDDFDMEMEDGSIRQRWYGLTIYRLLLKSGEFTEGSFTVKLSRG